MRITVERGIELEPEDVHILGNEGFRETKKIMQKMQKRIAKEGKIYFKDG